MPSPTRKVFIVSLDGATFDVLRPLAAQGYLPTLRRLFDVSLCSELESVIPPVTAPAWTSFMTGKTPDKHGIFDFLRFDAQRYKNTINNSSHIQSKTIWQIVSDHGKRVIVLNLPYTYPTYKVNGVMVAGWDAPSNSSFTFPDEVHQEVFRAVPSFGSSADLSLWNYISARSATGLNSFLDKLQKSFRDCALLASHFLATQAWDVFMVHFQQTDWIQHKLWSYIAKACGSATDHSERVEKIRNCYGSFDRDLAELLRRVKPFDPVQIVLSDHGFGGNVGTLCPNYLLRKMGLYQIQPSSNRLAHTFKNSRQGVMRRVAAALKSTNNKVRRWQMMRSYKSWADMAADTVPNEKSGVDWHRTKAAFVMGSEVGFIYVNVKGRGPFGCVAPGSEYESVVSDIIAQFSNLKHPHTREPLLVRVCRGKELYSSHSTNILLPDVVLVPQDGYVAGAGLSEPFLPATGELGNHRHNGILLIKGPGIRDSVPGLSPRLIDLAPTILHALGLPVPSDMDGRVLEEVFRQPLPVHFQTVDNSIITKASHDYAHREAELIEQRLRGLGYVE